MPANLAPFLAERKVSTYFTQNNESKQSYTPRKLSAALRGIGLVQCQEPRSLKHEIDYTKPNAARMLLEEQRANAEKNGDSLKQGLLKKIENLTKSDVQSLSHLSSLLSSSKQSKQSRNSVATYREPT